MKLLKKTVILAVMLISVFTFTSCGISNKMSVEDVVTYCEEKYNDKFSVVATGTELWTESYSELILASESLGSAQINVRVYSKDKILDNYIAVKYKSAVEEKVLPLVNSIYGKSLVVNEPINFGVDSFYADMSFEDYAKSADSSVFIAVATNASAAEKDIAIKRLAALLKREQICATVTVSYFDVENIEEIELSHNTGKVFKQTPSVKGFMNMNADFTIESVTWNDNLQ